MKCASTQLLRSVLYTDTVHLRTVCERLSLNGKFATSSSLLRSLGGFFWSHLTPFTQSTWLADWLQLTVPHRTFAYANHIAAHPSFRLVPVPLSGRTRTGTRSQFRLPRTDALHLLLKYSPHSHFTLRGAQKAVALSTELWAPVKTGIGFPNSFAIIPSPVVLCQAPSGHLNPSLFVL